jgi:CheY-like chemotaxis protein
MPVVVPSPGLPPIVFIDDEPDDIVFAVRALRSSELKNPVLRFHDPEEAIEHFKKVCAERVDTIAAAIFCDVKMPGLMGFDVVRVLRELPQMQHVPIWMLSGSDSPSDIARARASGANGYFVKPALPVQLAAVVQGQTELLPESAFEPKGFLSA